MAQLTLIEHNGQRIDITDLPRIYETRCDGCGEFVAAHERINATLSVIFAGGTGTTEVMEGHAGHVLDKLSAALDQLRREYFL